MTSHETRSDKYKRTSKSKSQLRGVLLDIDGTLLDSNDAHAKAWEKVLNEEGFKISFADVRRLMGMGGDKLLPMLTGIAADSNRGKRISKQRVQLFKVAFLPRLRPFPGAKELLESLHARGLRLAVATSASHEELNDLLNITGVQHLIYGEATSSDAAHSKPDKDIVVAGLEELQLQPHEVVMLGDTPYDIAAARSAYVDTIAFRSGGWRDDELSGAIAIYDHTADLLNHLEDSVFSQYKSYAA